jgi:threonine dehydrogenase-like Zn-dependent dehydrogenase
MVAICPTDPRQMVTHRYALDRGLEAFELLLARKGVKALIVPQGLSGGSAQLRH